VVLSDYLYLTRQLLRDANSRFFTDQFLTICINNARDKICTDSIVTRTNPNVVLVPNQEVYTYQTILAAALTLSPAPPARQIVVVLNVLFNQTGSLSPPLRRYAWSDFNRIFRTNPINSFPLGFAEYGVASAIYVQPTIPGTGYTMQVDCMYLPIQLTVSSPTETAIPDPLTELVPFFASFWATQYEQDATRATGFAQSYEMMKDYMMAAIPPWSIQNRNT
jgi:hypothetical protein